MGGPRLERETGSSHTSHTHINTTAISKSPDLLYVSLDRRRRPAETKKQTLGEHYNSTKPVLLVNH